MKRYILFTEEELRDMLNGKEIKHYVVGEGTVYFMEHEHYAKLSDVNFVHNFERDK